MTFCSSFNKLFMRALPGPTGVKSSPGARFEPLEGTGGGDRVASLSKRPP